MTYSFGRPVLPEGDTLHGHIRDTISSAIVQHSQRSDLHEAAAVVRSLSAAEIEKRGYQMLGEAVRTMAGVSVKDYGGIGGLKSVSVRNMGAAHTGISYDGFAIADAQNGQVDISRFMLENVSEVRVSQGLPDDIFTSARLSGTAGVVSILTYAGVVPPQKEAGNKKRLEASARLSGSCFGTWNPALHLGARLTPRSKINADANFLHSDGSYPFILENGKETTLMHRLNSDVNTFNGEVNYSYRPDRGELRVKSTYYQSERGLPGSVILYYQNPTERLYDRNYAFYAKYRHFWKNGWRADASASYTNAWNRYVNTASTATQDNTYLQQEACASLVAGWEGASARGRWSVCAAEDLFVNILDSDIPECPYPVRLSSISGITVRYSTSRLKITGSILGTAIKEWFRKEISGIDVPGNRLNLSPSLGLSYILTQDKSLVIRTFVKEGYRTPTFNDLYYARVGNTSLSSEKAFQSNLGLSWEKYYPQKKIGLNLTGDIYCNYIKDKIAATPTLFIWKMRNIGRVLMAGADVTASVHWTISPKVKISADANWSWQYAIDITNPSAKNYRHQIPYTPRHCGNLAVSAETYWITVTYTLIGVGDRYALPQNIPSNLIPSYTDHSISVGHTFPIGRTFLRASLEALNLSGNNYEIIKGYPMSGRSFRITIKFKY